MFSTVGLLFFYRIPCSSDMAITLMKIAIMRIVIVMIISEYFHEDQLQFLQETGGKPSGSNFDTNSFESLLL